MASGYYPYFVPIEGSSDTEAHVAGERKIMIGSNNYLGLTHHPLVVEAAQAAIKRYGSGCTGSRFLNGNMDLHEQLEARLAKFMASQAALVFSTGYQTNLGVIGTLVGRNDRLYLDKLDWRVCAARSRRRSARMEASAAAWSLWTACSAWRATSRTCRTWCRCVRSSTPFSSSTMRTR
jgi:hypothetical protein